MWLNRQPKRMQRHYRVDSSFYLPVIQLAWAHTPRPRRVRGPREHSQSRFGIELAALQQPHGLLESTMARWYALPRSNDEVLYRMAPSEPTSVARAGPTSARDVSGASRIRCSSLMVAPALVSPRTTESSNY